MSKKAIICTVLALAMILVGTGYAYWTDTLNITTNATTGDLDVTFVDLGLYAQYMNEHNPQNAPDNWSIIDGIYKDSYQGYIPAEFFERGLNDVNIIAKPGSIQEYYDYASGYNSVDFNAELLNPEFIPKTIEGGVYVAGETLGSDNILLTVNSMYPGYAQAFRTDVANIGSIAAKLSALKFDIKGDNTGNIKDMLGVALLVEREYYPQDAFSDGNEIFGLAKALINGTYSLTGDDFFKLGDVEFIRLSALERIGKINLDPQQELLAVPVKNRMDIYLGIAMDPDAAGIYTTGSTEVMNTNNNDADSQFKGVQVSIDFLWDQFNQGTEADTTNILQFQNH